MGSFVKVNIKQGYYIVSMAKTGFGDGKNQNYKSAQSAKNVGVRPLPPNMCFKVVLEVYNSRTKYMI